MVVLMPFCHVSTRCRAIQLPLTQSPVVWAVRGLQLAPVVVQVSWASTHVDNALVPAGFRGLRCAAGARGMWAACFGGMFEGVYFGGPPVGVMGRARFARKLVGHNT